MEMGIKYTPGEKFMVCCIIENMFYGGEKKARMDVITDAALFYRRHRQILVREHVDDKASMM